MKVAHDYWMGCYAYIEACLCTEFQRYGSCGCRTRRGRFQGTNPCRRHRRMLDDIFSLSVGATPPNGSTLLDVIEYIERYTCNGYRGGGCNHRKCNQATELLAWLHTEATKVAAA